MTAIKILEKTEESKYIWKPRIAVFFLEFTSNFQIGSQNCEAHINTITPYSNKLVRVTQRFEYSVLPTILVNINKLIKNCKCTSDSFSCFTEIIYK